MSKDVFRNGEYLGTIYDNGDIFRNGEYLGTIYDNGDVFRNGEYLGTVRDNGDVFCNGEYLGTVRGNGDMFRNGEYLGTVVDRGGADREAEETPSLLSCGGAAACVSASSGGGGGDLFLLPGAFFSLIGSCWPVLIVCFGIGLLLVFLTGAVRATGAIYAATEPHTLWILLIGAVGLVLMVWRRVDWQDRRCGWMTVLGSILVFLSATWFAAYRLGLIAAWAFPADFAGREEFHPLLEAGFAGCPGAQAVFGWFQRLLTGSSAIPLDRGLGGLLGGIETLARGWLDGGLPFLLAILLYLLTIPIGFLAVLLFVFLVPPLCLLIPFLPGIALVLLLGKLLSIGLK